MVKIEIIDRLEIVSEPTLEEIETLETEPTDYPDLDPDGWRIYSGVLEPETGQYIFRYARENPDNDYAQYRVEPLFYSNKSYRETYNKNIPGFEDRFYEEFAHLNPDNDAGNSDR